MLFINSEVNIAALPAVEKVELLPISKLYLKVLRMEWLLTSVIIVSIATAIILFMPSIKYSLLWVLVAATTLLVILIYFFLQEKSFPFITYAVRDKDVIFQRGWLILTTKVCPFNRIQNCSIQAGLLERRYGLASLTLFTAGSDAADIRIPGLLQEEAERLRQYILNKINDEATAH
ncbi:MAG: PH domain-containing protein [Chitinophagaceae bacterium]